MLGAAIFGTEKMEAAGSRRLEPEPCRAAGHCILLDAEGGDEKGVDHILAGKLDHHGTANGHMQGVDLALPARMLDLPHPLLADGADMERVFRDLIALDVKRRRPAEETGRAACRGGGTQEKGPRRRERNS